MKKEKEKYVFNFLQINNKKMKKELKKELRELVKKRRDRESREIFVQIMKFLLWLFVSVALWLLCEELVERVDFATRAVAILVLLFLYVYVICKIMFSWL